MQVSHFLSLYGHDFVRQELCHLLAEWQLAGEGLLRLHRVLLTILHQPLVHVQGSLEVGPLQGWTERRTHC